MLQGAQRLGLNKIVGGSSPTPARRGPARPGTIKEACRFCQSTAPTTSGSVGQGRCWAPWSTCLGSNNTGESTMSIIRCSVCGGPIEQPGRGYPDYEYWSPMCPRCGHAENDYEVRDSIHDWDHDLYFPRWTLDRRFGHAVAVSSRWHHATVTRRRARQIVGRARHGQPHRKKRHGKARKRTRTQRRNRRCVKRSKR